MFETRKKGGAPALSLKVKGGNLYIKKKCIAASTDKVTPESKM